MGHLIVFRISQNKELNSKLGAKLHFEVTFNSALMGSMEANGL